MLTRLVDFLKTRRISALLTSPTLRRSIVRDKQRGDLILGRYSGYYCGIDRCSENGTAQSTSLNHVALPIRISSASSVSPIMESSCRNSTLGADGVPTGSARLPKKRERAAASARQRALTTKEREKERNEGRSKLK